MSTLHEQVVRILMRHPVERLELSRRGELLAELENPEEPRWLLAQDKGEHHLAPERDTALPIARDLAELRANRGARVLSHRPGRRLVLQLDPANAGSILKAVRRRRLDGIVRCQREGALAAQKAGLVAAQVLSVDAQQASFKLNFLAGRRPKLTPDEAAQFERLGASLARLQTVPRPTSLERHRVADELEVLDRLAQRCSTILGTTPRGWLAQRECLQGAADALAPSALVLCHRDLHDKQLLFDGPRTGLLDLDLLCLSDAALDLANLLAHLGLRAIQGLCEVTGAERCSRALRHGFDAHEDVEGRLPFWQASAYLRLALVYHLRPPWMHLGPILVQRAANALKAEHRARA